MCIYISMHIHIIYMFVYTEIHTRTLYTKEYTYAFVVYVETHTKSLWVNVHT